MPDLVTVHYEHTGTSQKTNALGMREMQARAYDARNAQYLLVKSPPASGKSRALMYIGLDKIKHQGLHKVIVAVPERAIGASFARTELAAGGFFSDWVVSPGWNLTDAPGVQKTKAFAEFMRSNDEILVCTHATLIYAYNELGASAFAETLVAIDEFHHASADEESRLGEVVRGLIAGGRAHIVAMTGSYFRGDALPVLRPDDEARFTRVNYTYYEQLNGYDYLKSLGIGYHFYRGRYVDAINEVLDPKRKTIVHIPSVNAGESTKDKYDEVDRILDHLGEVQGRDPRTGFYNVRQADGTVLKVADLVDDGPERELVMKTLRDIKTREDIDIIIALGMAKEGFDWVWCEHVLTVGYRGSLTEVVQIIGRSTRDAMGKEHAQFTNLLAEPDVSGDRVSNAVNNMLKAISCSLLMEQVLAPDFKFRTCTDSDDFDGNRQATSVTLTGEQSIIAIRGLAEPSTARSKQIIESDLAELTANILQDERMIRILADADTYPAEVVNQVYIPQFIETIYPDLGSDEIEEIRQHTIARLVLQTPNTSMSHQGNAQFIKVADRFINIDDLSIDLINGIHPFQRAYAILSKAVTADVLQAIHTTILASRLPVSEEEAVMRWPEVESFSEAHERAPNIQSQDPSERRLAEVLIWVQGQKRKQMVQSQTIEQ